MGWIILVLLVLGGYFAYTYLVALEKEIRAEIGSGEDPSLPAAANEKPMVAGETAMSLAQRIEAIIAKRPGLMQSVLYDDIADVDRKVVQKALLELDRSGKILRTRCGNSFKLNLPG